MRDWQINAMKHLEENDAIAAADRERFQSSAEQSEIDCKPEPIALCEVLHRLLKDKRCEVVWNALERRSNPDAKTAQQIMLEAITEAIKKRTNEVNFVEQNLGDICLHRELILLKKIPNGNELDYNKNLEDMTVSLVIAISEILDEPVPSLTIAGKKEALEKIEKAIENLKLAINPIWDQSNFQRRRNSYPSEMHQFIDKSIHDWSWHIKSMRSTVEGDLECLAVAYSMSRFILNRPLEYLDALKADATAWASEAVEIPKPNDPNAKRLFFIRRLTAYFRDHYDSPLRACVLAISSVFFDCETLDESAISKLAP